MPQMMGGPPMIQMPPRSPFGGPPPPGHQFPQRMPMFPGQPPPGAEFPPRGRRVVSVQ